MNRRQDKLVNRARGELRRADWLRARGEHEQAELAATRAGDLYEAAGFTSVANAIFRGEIG